MLKPIVAITMGDPSGVGPEVVLKALADPAVQKKSYPFVLGDWNVLERMRSVQGGIPKLVLWKPGAPIQQNESGIPVYSLSSLSPKQVRPGFPTKDCGEAAYRYIRVATEMVLSGQAEALATAPISKSLLQLAGHNYPGHTELLADLTRTPECRMMLLGKNLKVVLVTGHLSLAQVPRALTRKGIRVTLQLTHQVLTRHFGLPEPWIAVAALNPHAGEEGILGSEEKKMIIPVVRQMARRGIRVSGPFPADTIFHRAVRGNYDAVVCMYHDQGLIALKLHHFFGGVALTLGLPFVRTSVDHGTAYDIAGTNKADPSSMREAILLAARLARKKTGGGKNESFDISRI